MKRVVLVVSLALLFSGCGGGADSGAGGAVEVVTALAPLADVAQRLGGDDVRVTNLAPPGVEPHDLELAPDDVAAIEDADLVIVMGRGFQPQIEDAAESRDGSTLVVLDTVEGGDGQDPHVWLDPLLMREIAGAVAEAMDVPADPYLLELDGLHQRYVEALAACERRVLVTAHDAFRSLAARYGLEPVAIAGVSPHGEPDPRRLAEVADVVRDEGVTTIFTEELVSPAVAEAIAREAGVRTAVLDPIETLDDGDTYVAAMDRNLSALRAALGCK